MAVESSGQGLIKRNHQVIMGNVGARKFGIIQDISLSAARIFPTLPNTVILGYSRPSAQSCERNMLKYLVLNPHVVVDYIVRHIHQ